MCPWWIRWYHRRLRRADRRFIYGAIVGSGQSEQTVERAWMHFITSPGQEHWHCPCAVLEREE